MASGNYTESDQQESASVDQGVDDDIRPGVTGDLNQIGGKVYYGDQSEHEVPSEGQMKEKPECPVNQPGKIPEFDLLPWKYVTTPE